MSEEPKSDDHARLKRVPVILRSWDGPNSRIGLEVDLSQMPWGPFDALGKRLNILLPTGPESESAESGSESVVEQALRFVEHAADRCGEFASLPGDDRESWLRSRETWEWIRKYLTSLWVRSEVDGDREALRMEPPEAGPDTEAIPADLPPLPGAASTLEVAAKALRETPLSVWRETVGTMGLDAPTREEAVQTLLGVARILSRTDKSGEALGGDVGRASASPAASSGEGSTPAAPEAGAHGQGDPQKGPDPDELSYDFAKGYDEGYQMGRKVGRALMSRERRSGRESG